MSKYKKITPRPAVEEDLDQVVTIEAYSNRPGWSKAAFAAELRKKNSHFWVLTDDDTDEDVHAFVVFSFPHEQAHIQTLAVKKSSRRNGLGIDLMRAVINYVLRNEGESIVLEVRKSNSSALALYQQLGFVVIHTIKKCYPDGEDGYSLIYRLSTKQEKESLDDDDTQQTAEEEMGIGQNNNDRPKNIN